MTASSSQLRPTIRVPSAVAQYWRVAVTLAAVSCAVWAERSKSRRAQDQLDSFTP